jgi:hypothetical protein
MRVVTVRAMSVKSVFGLPGSGKSPVGRWRTTIITEDGGLLHGRNQWQSAAGASGFPQSVRDARRFF